MRAGDVVGGRFAIERLAGSGGMGAVYRALDRATGEHVALKVLHGHDPHEVERFENEARFLAGIAHPNVVRYVDRGVTAEGQPFLVMEWLEGEDLADRLARVRLGVRESVSIARAVAEALGAAHARGIVHRDLKPRNVMLVASPHGASPNVKVVDFGIARAQGAARALTQTGAFMGTPGYMAPEQVKNARRVDARADIFALGALLHECLTGRPAFDGEHALAIVAKLFFEEAPRPSEIEPTVPPALDALVARMLAKDPDGRPADASAAAAELSAIEGAIEDSGAGPGAAAAGREGPAAITGGEQRLICVILAATGDRTETDPTAPTVAQGAAESVERELSAALPREGVRAEWLDGGAVVVTLEGAGSAQDQAARAASAAISLSRLLPDLTIALVTGRSEASGRLPVGTVIDRAAALLAGARGRGRSAGRGVLLDGVTRALLDVRFDVVEAPSGPELHDERAVGEAPRTLLGRPSPCVGRDRELRALSDLLDECVEEGVARAALITAPAGTGKSRLAAELFRRVQRRRPEVEVWAGRGDPLSRGSAFALIGAAIRRAAGILGGEPLAERREKLLARAARHVGDEARALRVAEMLGEVVGAPFPDEASPRLYAARQSASVMAEQIQKAWLELCAAECDHHPILVVLEDLHWGDLPSIRLVDLALRELAGRPLMALGLARPEVHDAFPRLWAERDVVALPLGELTRRAAESLVRHALGPSAGAAVTAAIVERAAGNAFYLEELIRAVAEGQGEALPETVLAMAEARLLALPSEARRLLRAASVFGDVFWGGAASALLGGTEAQGSRGLLDALVEREVVIRREASTFPGEVEYAFRHALLREAAYAMLSSEDRTLGHRLAAAWLEHAGESDSMVLAEHHLRGGQEVRAAGFFLRAAERALRGEDLDAAIARAERGLACGAQGEEEIALLSIRGEATTWKGDVARAEAYIDEVIAKATPGSAPWYWALAGRSVQATLQGRAERLAETASLALEATPLAGAAPALVGMLGALSWVLFLMGLEGLASAAIARMEEAGAALPARDLRSRAWLDYGRSARAYHHGGDAWQALAHGRRASLGFAEAGDAAYLAVSRLREAELYLHLGAWRAAEEALGTGTASGLRAPMARVIAAVAALQQGEAEQAIAHVTKLQGEPAAQSGFGHVGTILSLLSTAYLRLGDVAAAEGASMAAIAGAATARDRASALAAVADVRLAQRRAEDALAAAREGIALMPRRLHDVVQSRLLLAEAEALLATGGDGAPALAAARARLVEGAARIGDPGLRRSFLEDVQAHARTMAL